MSKSSPSVVLCLPTTRLLGATLLALTAASCLVCLAFYSCGWIDVVVSVDGGGNRTFAGLGGVKMLIRPAGRAALERAVGSLRRVGGGGSSINPSPGDCSE